MDLFETNMMSSGIIHIVRSDRISSFQSQVIFFVCIHCDFFICSSTARYFGYCCLGFCEQCWSAKTLEYLLGYWEVLVSPVWMICLPPGSTHLPSSAWTQLSNLGSAPTQTLVTHSQWLWWTLRSVASTPTLPVCEYFSVVALFVTNPLPWDQISIWKYTWLPCLPFSNWWHSHQCATNTGLRALLISFIILSLLPHPVPRLAPDPLLGCSFQWNLHVPCLRLPKGSL